MTKKDYLVYWRTETADRVLAQGEPVRYAASNQFGRVAVGDTVWLVTCREGGLRLLGRVVVGRKVGRHEAVQHLGTSDIWEATWYALAEDGTEQPVREIPIQQLAEQLRFESLGGNDRLVIADGLVNPQQLQALRRLTAESASLLGEQWAQQ